MKFNNSQPLWMPQGSVRAILALLIVVAVVAVAPDQVADLAKIVVPAYFVAKVANDARKA